MAERKLSEACLATTRAPPIPAVSFPMHNSPRVWLITSALAPVSIRLIRLLLAHGDYVAAGLPPKELEDEERSSEYKELINECNSGRKDRDGWRERIRSIKCDGRVMGQAQAAVAEAIELWGRIDILLCNTSYALVGTVEELAASSRAAQGLVRDSFEVIYFGQLNFIKATLPLLRARHNGHIVVLTGVTGHIGTPGMSIYSAAIWALEGFCDCLSYEVAPFNVKMSIVQPSKEVQVLTNRIVFAPRLPQSHEQQQQQQQQHYGSGNYGHYYDGGGSGSGSGPAAPSMREMLDNVVNAHPETRLPQEADADADTAAAAHARFPRLPSEARDRLVMETVHALAAIGGHENPPARHIVGHEGVASVQEKLKVMSEELEDFVEVSCAVDIFEDEDHHHQQQQQQRAIVPESGDLAR